jgi:DNA-binding response OmpR family regulator
MAAELWPVEGEILVVDPDPHHALTLANRLTSLGVECWCAENASRAEAQLGTRPGIRLAVVGHGKDAAAVISALRSRRPELLIVGTAVGDCSGDFHRLGVDEYVRKPVDPWSLAAILVGR